MMVPTGPLMKRFHWEKVKGVDLSKTVWGKLGEVDHDEIGLDMEVGPRCFRPRPVTFTQHLDKCT